MRRRRIATISSSGSPRSATGPVLRHSGAHLSRSTPADRRDLDDGEFWVEDLVGCDVVGQDGESIGVVESVEFGAAQDRLAVRTEAGRFEVPFVDAIVPEVDLERRIVVVTPPEGLFESA